MADDTSDTRGIHGTSGSARSGRGRRTAPRRRLARIAAWTVAGVVLVGGAGAGYLYFKINGNITGVDINQALGDDRPAQVDNGSEDILVLGSDSRAGANDKYGTDEGSARSDTAMIVHLYEGHRTASVVSIPRDTLITRPECSRTGGGTSPEKHKVMFNESYELGGPACAVKTVESLTGIRMDHYIEVDFTGFKGLIDALGGVPVTTTKAIHDKSSHLDLAAGTHTLNGEQSLGLVRTRHGVADGSDLGRIQLQQAFMKALMDRVNGLGVLSNPTKLYKVADKATKAITTDSELASISGLQGLAGSLSSLKSEHLDMVTLPVQYAKSDANRVEPLDAQAALIWQALKADLPIPAAALKGSAASETDAKGVVGSGS